MTLAPGARLGSYEILSLLGAGGMGEVYRARDTRLNRDVAIKVLPEAFAHDADRLARFKREAQVLASLNHPHIAAIYGIEEGASGSALILELVEGPTLADRIAQGPIPIDEALPIARQIAEALEAAHEHGVIHRDLKPANIKLTPDGRVKVLDFGLAKATALGAGSGMQDPAYVGANTSMSPTITSPTITSPAVTLGGVILGTAAYMSPEQAKGKAVDKRTDIWAFGCVLYEMLTGTRPFEGDDVSETLAAILRGEPDWAAIPGEAPLVVGSLIRRCLEKDHRQRIGDMAAVRFALADLALFQPTLPAVRPSRTWTKWAISAAACLLIVAATAGSTALVYLRAPVAEEPSWRLAVPIPEGSVLTHFALSPDGKRLALVLTNEDERAQIWLRPLDSTELHALPGTFGARAPFWSPDGRSMGFFADGKLKIVSANGGPPQDFCEGVGQGAGGAWNRDGVILVGGFRVGMPLRRVSADGGPCTELKVADGFAGYPHFLPDGRHFLYVVGGPDAAKRGGLYVADLESLTERRVLADVSSAVYSPSSADVFTGHLLFLRESNLMAVPFDARALEIVGDAFIVSSHASTSYNAPQIAADVSANGLLAYVANRAEATRFAWIDGTGTEIATVGSVAVQQNVQLSPNGEALLFTRGTTSWLRELGRNVETRLMDNMRTPGVWSRDSRFVAYGRATGQLFIREIATSKDETITVESNTPRIPSDWSHDGSVLLYTEVNAKTQSDIWALIDPRNTSSRHRTMPFAVSGAAESQAQMSPDQRWVAYTSGESGQVALYVKGFPDGAVKRISPAHGREPRWSADGRELYYLSGSAGRNTLNAVAIEGSASDLLVGHIEQLFEFRGRPFVPQANIFQYAVGRDRRRFLVNVLTSDAEPTLNVITNWRAAVQ